jgi:hypothetical protein
MANHLQRLPYELRTNIYQHLFQGLRLSLRRSKARAANHDGRRTAWQILFTCRRFWTEDLATFYDLSTVVLEHDMFLHVLKHRITPKNMALVRHLELRNLNMKLGGPEAARLPPALHSLVLWDNEAVTCRGATRLHRLDEERVRDHLRGFQVASRFVLNDSLMEMWRQSSQMKIFMWIDVVRKNNKDVSCAFFSLV